MHLTYEFYRGATTALAATSVGALSYALASAPTRLATRLGLRGLRRQRALQRSELWGSVEPLVRWLGVRLNGVVSGSLYTSIDRQLALAGEFLGLTPEEFVGLSVLTSVFGGVIGFLLQRATDLGALSSLIGCVIGGSLPWLRLSGQAQERIKQINRGLPSVIDLMALAMSAGLDFPNAVRQVVEKSSDPNDALVEEFTLILQELKLGKTRTQALRDLARRAPTASVDEFVASVVQAEERGNPVAEVLLIQAEASRQRRTVRAEEAAARAGVAMSLPLLLLFACAMLLVVGPTVLKLIENAD